ncbi:MAG TPA: hypothetical protein QF626_10795 [Prochlorococcaceae cyanobacterium Fu_MAG_50]|nr:hypothetical protein [Prochlorococcaceae cyanobacterium Fu_MAG_50]
MTMMIGLVLLAAASGLLVRQLTARKLGASESYQQMAEEAAGNGFNRILAVLNDVNQDNYRGHLFTIDDEPPQNDENGTILNTPWRWEEAYIKDEFCADKPLPTLVQNDTQWPRNSIGYGLNSGSLREDSKGEVKTYYRLRSFSTSYSDGAGTGIFEVEGLVKRVNASESPVIARALLTRSLQLESKVNVPGDWAVVASRVIDDGTININGPGRYIWDVTSVNASTQSGCNGRGNINYQPAIQGEQPLWPVLNRGLPDQNIYTADGTVDSIEIENTNYIRIWSFDDTQLSGEDPGISCANGRSIVCSRPFSTGSHGVPLPSSQIESTSSDSNTNTPATSIEYKTFRKRRFGNTRKVKTATCKSNTASKETNCRSEDKNNGNWDWSDWRNDLSGSDIKIWRFKPGSSQQVKQQGTCNKGQGEGQGCNINANYHWDWSDEDNNVDDTTATEHTIKINGSDICNNKPDSNVCHLYIEHLKLSKTNLYIENDENRPVVLHFGLPEGQSKRNDLSGTFKLESESQLCGVDSTAGDAPSCNQQPQQLVITTDNGMDPASCPGSGFEFTGNTLPAAWISLTKGRVNLVGDVQMRGVIWASSVCTSGSLQLTTAENNVPYVNKAIALWNWPAIGFKGFGRTIVRGIRGTGYDIFKRW